MLNRRTLIVGSAGFVLASCANNSSGPAQVPPPPLAPAGTIDLTSRGWVFAYGSAQPPFRNGLTFDIPARGDIHYLVCPINQSIIQKQSVSFDFDIAMSPDAVLAATDSGETCPCKMTVILGEQGDNLSGSGVYQYYRWFSHANVELVPGSRGLSVPLTLDNWGPIGGNLQGAGTPQQGFDQCKNRLQFVGLGFGGMYFGGHGVYLKAGSASITIKSAVLA